MFLRFKIKFVKGQGYHRSIDPKKISNLKNSKSAFLVNFSLRKQLSEFDIFTSEA